MVKRVLTIAGSDSGGGAGIQADLKTFSALGVYGSSVITAITAQNTVSVDMVFELEPDMVSAQIDSVMEDIGADAVKTGMLANQDIVNTVAQKMKSLRIANLVVDPVMVAKSGDRLLENQAVDAYRSALIPLAHVVTPNIPEAEVLVGYCITSKEDTYKAAKDIHEMGAKNVVIKGGHREGPVIDLLYSNELVKEFTASRVDSQNTHGTGCTFASALTAYLALGHSVEQAVFLAKDYVTEAIKAAFPIGRGHGPLNHFYSLWGKDNY